MAFDALQVLQAAAMGEQRRLQQQQMQTRQQAGGMAAAGDYQGARQTALQTGDFDFADQISKLDATQRQQAAMEARALYGVATQLKKLPVEQRAQALQSYAPVLMQHGFSQEEIANADLSDQGLAGYEAVGLGFMRDTQADEPSVIRTLRAVGIDPTSPEGRDLVTRSISAPRYLPNGDGTFTVIGGGGPAPMQPQGGGDIPPQAIAALRAGEGSPEQFDSIFGPGAAQRAMGGAPSQGGASFP